jgi:prepilin-type N-terminal cleavage/methylation domain-containing protein
MIEKNNQEHKQQTISSKGFSLLELLLAMTILVIGVASVATMIGYSINSDLASKNETVAVIAAERELERLRNTTYSSLTDGGSTLDSYGKISFSGSQVNGYFANVALSDQDQVGKTATFDVRWNITTIAGTTIKKITIAAQRLNGNARFKPIQMTYIKAQ